MSILLARLPTARTALVYQALWLSAVLGAARLGATAATLTSVLALGACLASHPLARTRRAVPAAAAGYGSDAVLCALGVFTFGDGTAGVLPPAWLGALWLGFAVSFPALFGWLCRRPLLTAVLGGIGGTLSYASALRLGAAATPNWIVFLCVMPPVWAVRLLLLRAWWLRPAGACRPSPASVHPEEIA